MSRENLDIVWELVKSHPIRFASAAAVYVAMCAEAATERSKQFLQLSAKTPAASSPDHSPQ